VKITASSCQMPEDHGTGIGGSSPDGAHVRGSWVALAA
jgi:hypothetical protein